jgi:ATP-dependent helicase/nuclease subunit A
MSIATFIEANAGTGKTYELTSHILQKVSDGVPLKEICAVTFTEKAATEMVERLRTRMAELVSTGHMDAKRFEEVNQGFIGTIHAFCTQVLKRYGNRIGLTPLFEVDADQSHFTELFESHWDRFLSGVLRGMREPYPKLIEIFGIENLKVLAEHLSSRRYTFTKPDGSVEWLFNLIQDPDAWNANESHRWDAAFLNGLKEPQKNRASLSFMLAFQQTTLKDTAWKNAIKDALNYRNDDVYEAVHSLMHDFVRYVLEEYKSLGYLRYDDLILDTRNLLRDHTDVRRRLKERYRIVLVDEMQDTDPVQYEIFLYLCEQDNIESDFRLHDLASGKFTLKLQPRKLFVVGDPKQSIYGFRSADPEAYSTIKNILGKEAVEVTALTGNYRSCKNLVEFTNALAERLFPGLEPEPSITKKDYCNEYEIHDCVRLVKIETDENDALHLRILSEANWLAKEIKERAESEAEGNRYRGTAILLRRLTNAHLYVDALSARGIPVVIEGEKFFFQSQEVIDFVNLLKWIVDDMDLIAMAATLRSPLFGLSDLELAIFFSILNTIPKADEPFPTAESALAMVLKDASTERRETILSFQKSVVEIRRMMPQLNPGKLVDEVLARFPLLSLAAISYGNHRREISPLNILKIHKQALEADLDPLVSTYSFVKQLERYSRELKDLGQEAVADEGVDAVKILSIHRAKGLDFPITYIALTDYGGGNYVDKTDIKQDWRTDTASVKIGGFTEANYLRMMYAKRSLVKPKVKVKTGFELDLSDEEKRVLYVAATRAKHELCFTLAGDDPKNTGGKNIFAFLDFIHPDVNVTMDKAEPWLPSGVLSSAREKISLEPVATAWSEIESIRNRRTLPVLNSITAEALSLKAGVIDVGNEILRPGLADAGSEGRASQLAEEAESEFEFVSMHARIVGLLCHAVLEQIDFQSPNNFRSLLEIEKCKLSDAHSGFDLEAAEDDAEKILETFLQSAAANWIASLEILGREVPVCVFDQNQNKALTGTIDLLAMDQAGQYYLLDYKAVTEVDEESLQTYAKQMELYGRALNISHTSRLILLKSGKIVDLPPGSRRGL